MTGIDYEPLEEWRLDGFDGVRRRAPVRLLDRESFGALLKKFSEYQAGQPFMLSVNEEDFDSRLPLDELFAILPPRIVVLHLQSEDADYIVRLSSWSGGETWVSAPQRLDDEYVSPLRTLVGIIEHNSKPLGWRRHLSRARWPKRLARYRLPVVERTSRDIIESRRHDTRAAVVGGVFGLIGGVVGAAATLFVGT